MIRQPFHVLFVCTGNIFRSMSAEYALKSLIHDRPYIVSSSAGTEAKTQEIHSEVKLRLKNYGIDPSGHRQRKLTKEILERASIVIVMGEDHREFLAQNFNHNAPLFLELAADDPSPVLDVHEAVPDWESNLEASQKYIHRVIDDVVTLMPSLLSVLEERFLKT